MEIISAEYVEKKGNFYTFENEAFLYIEALRDIETKFLLFFFKYISLPKIYVLNENYGLEFYYNGENRIIIYSKNKQEVVDLINLINSHKFINYEEEEA